MENKLLIDNLSVPLDGVETAKVDIDTSDGNLTIDRLAAGEQLLASGTLQYLESQGAPYRSVTRNDGQATLAVKRSGRTRSSWFSLPWAACNGATECHIQLNPAVSCDITAHSGGGNVKLNLAGMAVTRVSADTGGGNMEVVLPGNTTALGVDVRSGAGNVSVEIGTGTRGSNIIDAKSGAGNVTVRVPGGIAARVQASSGMGKVIVDPRFRKNDKNTYQLADFESAADKVEITARTGAGNVRIESM